MSLCHHRSQALDPKMGGRRTRGRIAGSSIKLTFVRYLIEQYKQYEESDQLRTAVLRRVEDGAGEGLTRDGRVPESVRKLERDGYILHANEQCEGREQMKVMRAWCVVPRCEVQSVDARRMSFSMPSIAS